MLENTFIHLPGISQRREQDLWQRGILSWEDLRLALPEIVGPVQHHLFSSVAGERSSRGLRIAQALDQSRDALARGDAGYFAALLPAREHYRIALSFPDEVAFLDIETTGLSHYYNSTTVIGASMGGEYRSYLVGQDIGPMKQLLSRAKCMVTFNGKVFDLRFLRKEFPDLHLPIAHVDLRFFGKRAGFTGGQKQIEAKLGFHRPATVEGVVGEFAPVLWDDYRAGSVSAAKALIRYNHADVEGMRTVLDACVQEILDQIRYPYSESVPRFVSSTTKIQFASSKKSTKRNRIYVPRYSGKKGPSLTFAELATYRNGRSLRIVGIDLTGSENRPTGWCFLNGNEATTELISTDKELIERTEGVHPDLVSIDSPLSLPVGRKTVTDDDPSRDEYGIMRHCERVLKRRGVNVYPCLIQSMQRLTARGIKLAAEFRKRGLPVIESYPGAAQDIMGIQRKRKGLQHLKRGLLDFGIRGCLKDQEQNHDELDAITSAIVGLFFWSGRFEALGNEDEEYLIIPELRQSPSEWLSRSVVGISGRISAGKTTAAKFFTDKGYAYGRFSMILNDILESEGKVPNRQALQQLGAEIHIDPGQRWLAKQLVQKLPTVGNLVVDGLRFPEDHAFMVETYGPAFLHVHVVAKVETRRSRYVAMGNRAEEFDAADHHEVEAESVMLPSLANIEISNEGTMKEFNSQLIRAIKTSWQVA